MELLQFLNWFFMKLATLLLLSVAFIAGPAEAKKSGGGEGPVRGYVKRDGTYVAPHHRTTPNHTQRDNWSSKPNTNPYTGKSGSREPTH